MAGKRSPLSLEDKQFIRDNAGVLSDAKIAEKIGKSRRTIAHFRKEHLGVEAATRKSHADPFEMTEESRAKFFREHLENDHFWDMIRDQLTDPELDFYISEWASLAVQFRDIVATERRQIHDLIMTEILDSRLLKKIKFVEEEINVQVKIIDSFREIHDIDDDEQAAERDETLMHTLAQMRDMSRAIGREHEALVKQKNDILTHLNGRRKDRLDQIRDSSESFVGYIEGIRNNPDVLKAQARFAFAHAEQVEKLRQKWMTEEVRFPDGRKDKVLTNSG
jgi:hypothetical protein